MWNAAEKMTFDIIEQEFRNSDGEENREYFHAQSEESPANQLLLSEYPKEKPGICLINAIKLRKSLSS